MVWFVFLCYVDHLDLHVLTHSSPARRSSDLGLWGNGRLDAAAPGKEPVDRFRYDPLNPVPTVGGGDCCNGGIVVPGAFDQRSVEARDDVLVYTSEPLEKEIGRAHV